MSKPRATPEDRRVGERLRARRLELGLTQQKLADRVGAVTYQQVHKYEVGINRVSASRLAELARALEIEPGWFFADGEVVTPERPRQALELVKLLERLTPPHQDALMRMARALAGDTPAAG